MNKGLKICMFAFVSVNLLQTTIPAQDYSRNQQEISNRQSASKIGNPRPDNNQPLAQREYNPDDPSTWSREEQRDYYNQSQGEIEGYIPQAQFQGGPWRVHGPAGSRSMRR